MRQKFIKILMMGLISIMVTIPCGTKALAAETSGVQESVPMTETKSASKLKIFKDLDKLKAQIAGLLNIDIGQIDKVIVKTTDKVNVILKDSNVDVNIDIKLFDIDIIINQK